jgi:ABC-type oligopeptide transport system substrate-binding subunit
LTWSGDDANLTQQMLMRRLISPAAAVAGVGGLVLFAVASTAGGSGTKAPKGGVFRVVFGPPEQLDTMDPAKANTQASWALLDLTCARLMTYPDAPPPRAFHLVPEVAAAPPKISHNGKVYTFTLRRSFRFSDGKPVDARAFARAINRTLSPGLRSLGVRYMEDIVGARAVLAGKAQSASGVVARGHRLVVRLERPLGDFPARTSMPFFCAVPPNLPADPEGRGAFPGSGPYYVTEYRPGQRVTIKRNPRYGGKRPHHVGGFVADLAASSPKDVLDRIEDGRADWGIIPPPLYFAPERDLIRKYGINKGQFRVHPGFTLRAFMLNVSSPLFRGNAALRKAINYAIDRPAFAGSTDPKARVTDQFLPPQLPGFRNAKIYPLRGPNLAKARALARGHLRSGKATLYVADLPLTIGLGQILKKNLEKIGLDVQVTPIPQPAYDSRITAPGEPFDIAFFVTPSVDYYDPYAFLNLYFESRFLGRTNSAHLRSAKYDRRLRAAAALRGKARLQAYGRIDANLMREVAPVVPLAYLSEPTLVSKRVGCLVLRPTLDLVRSCIKR